MFKKLILITILLCTTAQTVQASSDDIRIQGIAYVGVLLGFGGVYQLCKKSSDAVAKVMDSLSGAALLAGGIACILVSAELVREANRCFR